MWTHEESIETHATPARIWQLFADIPAGQSGEQPPISFC